MHDIEESASILIKDNDGNEKIYYKLSEFSINGKDETYLLYTDYSKTDDNLNIFYGILKNDYIEKVTEEADKEIILKYIETIEKDIKNGMNF